MLGVAAEGSKKETAVVFKMRGGRQLLKCALLNGSAWSTERKYMRRRESAISSLGLSTD